MKSLFATLATLLFVTNAAHADYRLGVVGGLNFANLRDARGLSDTDVHGVAGLSAEIPWNESFTFAPQIRFISKGGSTNLPGVNADISLRDIEVPLYLKYAFLKRAGFVPYAFIGPAVSFHVGSRVTATTLSGQALGASAAGSANSVELSLDGGVGTDIPLTQTINLSVNVAYSVGLTNAFDLGPYAERTRGFQTYLGLSRSY